MFPRKDNLSRQRADARVTDPPWGSYVRRVVIQTTSYLNFDGTYLAGGRQRHIRDLAAVIRDDWKREVVIVQKAWRPFSVVCKYGFRVMGIEANCRAYGDPAFARSVRRTLQNDDGLLYASGEDAWPFFQRQGKAIQHGVWWDGPQSWLVRSFQTRRAVACVRSVRSVLCVDTNFINWLRCQGRSGVQLCNKCVYIPNYADISAIETTAEFKAPPLRLICARRFEEKRGTTLFIEALGLLKRKRFPFSAHISTVGGVEEIRRRLEELDLHEDVGIAEDDLDGVLRRYQAADIAVLPTIWSEGTSLAAVEAICAGAPVIGTPVGGLGNLIVPGFNGFLVPPTPQSLSEAIARCADLQLLRHMRANCLSMRNAFSRASWKARVIEWLES